MVLPSQHLHPTTPKLGACSYVALVYQINGTRAFETQITLQLPVAEACTNAAHLRIEPFSRATFEVLMPGAAADLSSSCVQL